MTPTLIFGLVLYALLGRLINRCVIAIFYHCCYLFKCRKLNSLKQFVPSTADAAYITLLNQKQQKSKSVDITLTAHGLNVSMLFAARLNHVIREKLRLGLFH